MDGISSWVKVAFSLSVWVLDDMAARKWWLAVAAIWFLLLEWWRTASARVHSQGVGSLEIRHLERVDLDELPNSGGGLGKRSAGTEG